MPSTTTTREQWKLIVVLALFWATLFGALGIFFPYYSLYLKENLGLSGQQVGMAMGVFHLVGLVGQPAWGYLADRTGARKTVLVVITLGMALGFIAYWYAKSYAALLLVSMLFAAFYTSLVPQGLALSLGLLYRSSNSHFEWVRSIGSVGFLITCFGFPILLEAIAVTLGATEAAQPRIEAFKAGFFKGNGALTPLTGFDGGAAIGIMRHMVIAETEKEAMAAARPAYNLWYANLTKLQRENVNGPKIVGFVPPDLESAMKAGSVLVGTPAHIREKVAEHSEVLGINYLICGFYFGNIEHAHALQSLNLFAGEIAPAFY